MSKVTFNKDKHSYITENGTVLISVTQLLQKHGIAPSFKAVDKDVLEKAANRGTMIHAEFEDLIKSKGMKLGISNEVNWFNDEVYPNYDYWLSEEMIFTVGLPTDYAGTIDLIASKDGKISIMDIKTGGIHPEAVAWQLSLYRFAYCRATNMDTKDVSLFCIDAKEDKSRLIPIIPIPDKEIMNLLECERDDVPYTNTTLVASNLLAKIDAFESAISQLKRLQEEKETEYKKFKSALLNSMTENGIKTLETKLYKITRVDPTTQTGFDSKKLKEDDPELFEKYNTKVTKKDGYLKITEKK